MSKWKSVEDQELWSDYWAEEQAKAEYIAKNPDAIFCDTCGGPIGKERIIDGIYFFCDTECKENYKEPALPTFLDDDDF